LCRLPSILTSISVCEKRSLEAVTVVGENSGSIIAGYELDRPRLTTLFLFSCAVKRPSSNPALHNCFLSVYLLARLVSSLLRAGSLFNPPPHSFSSSRAPRKPDPLSSSACFLLSRFDALPRFLFYRLVSQFPLIFQSSSTGGS